MRIIVTKIENQEELLSWENHSTMPQELIRMWRLVEALLHILRGNLLYMERVSNNHFITMKLLSTHVLMERSSGNEN